MAGDKLKQTEGDILELLRVESIAAERRNHRALIVQPGAIGDCLLTLPLVNFMKEKLSLGKVDMLSHTEYTGIFPGRTQIDSVTSIDTLDLNRLYIEPEKYNPIDRDPLIHAFTGYAWIATFLGDPGSNFEQNLIFTANCSYTTEVITLALKPPEDISTHIADYFIEQFINQSNPDLQYGGSDEKNSLIKATKNDIKKGREILNEAGLKNYKNVIILHPGSGGKYKCWHLDNFLAVAEKLRSKSAEVVFLLGPAERERFNKASIKKIANLTKCLTDLSLSEVLSLLSCATGFIGNDSGITHLAAMLGLKTISVFGPTNPDIYKPIGPNVRIIMDKTATFTTKSSVQLQQDIVDYFLS